MIFYILFAAADEAGESTIPEGWWKDRRWW
jgi:hypothetical protein